MSKTKGDEQSVSTDSVVNPVKTESCVTDVLDGPAVKQFLVPENQVKQVVNEAHITDVDGSTTNVWKAEGQVQAVTVDICRALVLGDNVLNQFEAERCITDVLDEPSTEPVSPLESPAKQVDGKRSMTNFDESITNLSKVEDSQPVTVDSSTTLVPGDNVVINVEAQTSVIEVLNELVKELVSIPDDRVKQVERERSMTDVNASTTNELKAEGDDQSATTNISTTLLPVDNVVTQVEPKHYVMDVLDEPVKNVHDKIKKHNASILEKLQSNNAKTYPEGDDQSVIVGVPTTLVRADYIVKVEGEDGATINVVDKHVESSTVGACNGGCPSPTSGPTCSEWRITQDVTSSEAEAISIRALSAGSPFECEEPRPGYVDIDSVKPPEQVSHVPSSHVASVSRKEGLPQHPSKVEGKEFDEL